MTLVNMFAGQNAAYFLTDSLAENVVTGESYPCTKAAFLPHIGGIVAGRGTTGLIWMVISGAMSMETGLPPAELFAKFCEMVRQLHKSVEPELENFRGEHHAAGQEIVNLTAVEFFMILRAEDGGFDAFMTNSSMDFHPFPFPRGRILTVPSTDMSTFKACLSG